MSAQAGYLVSAHKGGRSQAAARELPEDVAVQARPTRVQDHIRVHVAVRMVPLLRDHTGLSSSSTFFMPFRPAQGYIQVVNIIQKSEL